MSSEVPSSIFSDSHNISKSLRLQGYAGVFQAEVSGSQPAVIALESVMTSPKLKGQYKDTLNNLGRSLKVSLLLEHKNLGKDELVEFPSHARLNIYKITGICMGY